ncbi:hypothetical protein WJX73_006878 [Symbiochloris irregularis]|uniref:Uncharacterized protein n=1 Tax=Symbiochloris irregularis TaxID=706552 RepID=A0AAW1PQ37_9CHLO
MKEVLVANAARLSPAYKQRCRPAVHADALHPRCAPSARLAVIAAESAKKPTGPPTKHSVQPARLGLSSHHLRTAVQPLTIQPPQATSPTPRSAGQHPSAANQLKALSPPNVHGSKRLIVKVIVNGYYFVGGLPHLISDELPSFRFYVGHESPVFYQVLKIVKCQQNMRRDKFQYKGYMWWCERASDTTLRIFLNNLPRHPPDW